MKSSNRLLLSSSLVAIVASLSSTGATTAAIFEKNGLAISGDFRTRLEADWDSQQADGQERDDRTRARARIRLGVDYTANERFSFGLRLRSGANESQQSAHITLVDLDNNDTGDANFNLDKWYLKGQLDKGWAWVGRNSLPFWKQNEMVWDDDVTPAGVAFGYRANTNSQVNAGYFSLPAGMRQFSGYLGLVQIVLQKENFTLAGGLLDIEANPDDPDGVLLLRGNAARDYQIWVVSCQAGVGKWKFGIDGIHNGEGYETSEALHTEVDGFVGSLNYDSGRGWQASYSYSHIEALALSSSYTQDDWVRWGSSTQTRATDMKGHELRLVKDMGSAQNLVFRFYVAEAITNAEDGSRLRVDWNYKF